ncbi:p-hydroxybenzoic acid efflux pump subunit AaeA [Methylobacterium frigidaeris]|uniref:p-hydroxybenzoic acid efflux pump subunit AaeA n=2 Tax=Methylobacterium frigidaeris TaxID=2038277 RepID=A0AA37H7W8_9HYPH|nr:p-hydroxybenzoic acid efflux pump subunit AaeA [Methylobacterium frigidaeris]
MRRSPSHRHGDAKARGYQSNADALKATYDGTVADLAKARLNLERVEVRSPVNGTVTNLLLQSGTCATVGQAAMRLIDADSFRVTAYFEETQLERVRVGDPATVTLLGYPGTPLKGRVGSLGRGITDPNAAPGVAGPAGGEPRLHLGPPRPANSGAHRRRRLAGGPRRRGGNDGHRAGRAAAPRRRCEGSRVQILTGPGAETGGADPITELVLRMSGGWTVQTPRKRIAAANPRPAAGPRACSIGPARRWPLRTRDIAPVIRATSLPATGMRCRVPRPIPGGRVARTAGGLLLYEGFGSPGESMLAMSSGLMDRLDPEQYFHRHRKCHDVLARD